MPYRILLRRDNSATWLYNDPVLMTGEPGYETVKPLYDLNVVTETRAQIYKHITK